MALKLIRIRFYLFKCFLLFTPYRTLVSFLKTVFNSTAKGSKNLTSLLNHHTACTIGRRITTWLRFLARSALIYLELMIFDIRLTAQILLKGASDTCSSWYICLDEKRHLCYILGEIDSIFSYDNVEFSLCFVKTLKAASLPGPNCPKSG